MTDSEDEGNATNDRPSRSNLPEDWLPDDLDRVRDELRSWYRSDHREFPWRQTTDPYEILVSEVMSQQTQLSRVVDAYESFLDRWPDPASLAAADRSAVVSFWSAHSLGYNNRAKYLHEAAEQIVEEFDGEVPETPEDLQTLQGVGPYTANAVASFAFNNGDAVVDTNVKRVCYRAFGVPDDDNAFERAARTLMPDGESRLWNNAIMELGGVACTKSPRCDKAGCPWRDWCGAYAAGDFTAPDVPEQPEYEGSRRQMRARVLDVLRQHGTVELDDLGPRVRVDYTPDGEGEATREWLRGLIADLEDDGLVERIGEDGKGIEVQLRQ